MESRFERLTSRPLLVEVRKRASLALIDGSIRTLSLLGKLHPQLRSVGRRIERVKNVPYLADGDHFHTCDIYRPRERSGPLPVMLYIHGGGFRILSKDTHWLMGRLFADQGMVVVNINYRLTPAHPFPDGLIDCCRAAVWVKKNVAEWGGDPERIHFSGESAGANLATSLAIACRFERPEHWTQELFAADVRPRTVIAACGMLQVSHPERFWGNRRLSVLVRDRISAVSQSYLARRNELTESDLALADPLVVLEQCSQSPDHFPSFFAFVGTKDPLEEDTQRLQSALERLEIPCRTRYYPGGVHAFHAFYFARSAQECWQDQVAFLGEHLDH
ncbi:MAG: alpha/beta hydrolase [Bradymonadales bacterium]|nr:alpha/beta hydrolase [Bradymonadales bacterium]